MKKDIYRTERRIVDVCDGDYTEVLVEVQDKCAQCGCDILHKAHAWSKKGQICIDCDAENMQKWLDEQEAKHETKIHCRNGKRRKDTTCSS